MLLLDLSFIVIAFEKHFAFMCMFKQNNNNNNNTMVANLLYVDF